MVKPLAAWSKICYKPFAWLQRNYYQHFSERFSYKKNIETGSYVSQLIARTVLVELKTGRACRQSRPPLQAAKWEKPSWGYRTGHPLTLCSKARWGEKSLLFL